MHTKSPTYENIAKKHKRHRFFYVLEGSTMYHKSLVFSSMSKKHVKKKGVANRNLQHAPEASQDALKMSQDPHETSQDAPRWPQDGAKISPRGPQMTPKRRLTPPRCTQDAFKMTLGHPKPPPRRPKSPQDHPEMPLTPSKDINLESISNTISIW